MTESAYDTRLPDMGQEAILREAVAAAGCDAPALSLLGKLDRLLGTIEDRFAVQEERGPDHIQGAIRAAMDVCMRDVRCSRRIHGMDDIIVEMGEPLAGPEHEVQHIVPPLDIGHEQGELDTGEYSRPAPREKGRPAHYLTQDEIPTNRDAQVLAEMQTGHYVLPRRARSLLHLAGSPGVASTAQGSANQVWDHPWMLGVLTPLPEAPQDEMFEVPRLSRRNTYEKVYDPTSQGLRPWCGSGPVRAKTLLIAALRTLQKPRRREHYSKPRGELPLRDVHVLRVVPPGEPPPAPRAHVLGAEGKLWVHLTCWLAADSLAEWNEATNGAPAAAYRERGLSPVVRASSLAGQAWKAAELANRRLIWHLSQHLAPEAGWQERWDELTIRRSQQIYVRSHFGRQLGLV